MNMSFKKKANEYVRLWPVAGAKVVPIISMVIKVSYPVIQILYFNSLNFMFL